MIELYDNETGAGIGQITEEQLQFLIDELEETSEEDQDYYLHAPALEMLAQAGADDDLLAILKLAVGDADGVEIRWERVTID